MEEPSTGECRNCHGTFCARCLVYSFGPKKPPFCVGCALVASGVRNGARRSHQPRTSTAAEPTMFASAPALFADETHGHGGGPGEPPTPGGTAMIASSHAVKSSWSNRRAQRQAAKASRRSAQDANTGQGTETGPLEAQNLEPMLSPSQRKALGQLSASTF
jgi:hypothetical protein